MLSKALATLKSTLQNTFKNDDRRAKIQSGDFILGLLHALSVETKSFSLASLRLAACAFLNKTIGRSAFNERMATPNLRKQVYKILQILMKQAFLRRKDPSVKGLVQKLGVKSIIGVDSSLVSLWEGLSDTFKGTFMTAAIKLHLAIDLVNGVVQWFVLTPGSVHDSQQFPSIKAGYLYLTDLGYWSVRHFKHIHESRGWFLSRLKSIQNLRILDVISKGLDKSLIGSHLSECLLRRGQDDCIEFLGWLGNDQEGIQVRVIGFWHRSEACYRWYITNLEAPREVIAELYRLRWQIELSFKGMKSFFNFDNIPTLSPNTTETLCLLAMCNYVLSTILRAETCLKNKKELSLLRSMKAFRAVASQVYSFLRFASKASLKMLNKTISSLMPLFESYADPNSKHRKNSIDKLREVMT